MAKAAEIVGLDCAAPVSAGAVLVLRTRLEEMCGWRAAALVWSEPKSLHDMRVASRRLRSAARDFAPYLAARPPRKRLRRLARALGAVRNEDVAISALEELTQESSPENAAGLRALIAVRMLKREHARATLAPLLAESALAKLRDKYLRTLARDEADATGTDERAHTFMQAGREIIAARLVELRALGAALYRPHATRRQHRLRIAAKRLRYALDLFVPCGGDELHELAREVARLQKALGDLHDCDEWITNLSALLEGRAQASGDASLGADADAEDLRPAAFWLLDKLMEERATHLRAALERWASWEAEGFFARITAALADLPTSSLT
jgi:CHAD domain-containing protein